MRIRSAPSKVMPLTNRSPAIASFRNGSRASGVSRTSLSSRGRLRDFPSLELGFSIAVLLTACRHKMIMWHLMPVAANLSDVVSNGRREMCDPKTKSPNTELPDSRVLELFKFYEGG